MSLRIQDPKYPNAPSLHESILEACRGAIKGGGAFAFVSRRGVKLLLRDEIFTEFVKSGEFDLVVGIDEITNVKTLEDLAEVSQELAGLTVRVFHHEFRGAVFHPKFCWFRHKSGGVLIIGSGNLTARGLRGNWEAFTVSKLSLEEIGVIEKIWTDWTRSHVTWLKAPDDAQVLARAAQNVWKPAPGGTGEVGATIEKEEAEAEFDEVAPGPPERSDAVLVAEIPKSGYRWNQANFDLETFRNFFGARRSMSQRVLFQHVDANGVLGKLESRPSVYVKSQNYRFQLEAGAGLLYPKEGRPIEVFIRVATRAFRYRLLMPNDPHYATVSAFLDAEWTGRKDRMRRVITNTEALRHAWPDSPFWRVA
jgi:hypothetical protein